MKLEDGRIYFAITSCRYEKRRDADDALRRLQPVQYAWDEEGPEPREAILYDAPESVCIDGMGTLHWDVPEGATDEERAALRPRKIWQGMLPPRPDNACASCGCDSTIFDAAHLAHFDDGDRLCLHCHMEFNAESEQAA